MYDTPEYKRSRKAYAAQCTFEYFVTIFMADAFLAELLSSVGMSDAMVGIISSFVTVAFLFQLISIFTVQKIKRVKGVVTFSSVLSQLMVTCLYLIPFLPADKNVKTALVVGFILLYYLAYYLVAGMIFKWGNSFVDPGKRAVYSAKKEMLSLITGMVFTFTVGWVIDRYDALGDAEGGFLFISLIVLILSICNFISLMLIKKDLTPQESKPSVPLKEVFRNTLGNRNFNNVLILTILWDIARYTTIGFMGIYKTKELLLTVGTVQIINIVGNLFRSVISIPFGKYSDKTSYVKGFKAALYIAAAGFFINAFSTPSTVWCVVIFTVLNAVSTAGTNQNSFNIVYSYVKSDYFVQATAIKNGIGGIFGFLASLVGGKILTHIQTSGNMLFGIPMYGQQCLSFLSFVVIIITILFIRLVMEKQKVMRQ